MCTSDVVLDSHDRSGVAADSFSFRASISAGNPYAQTVGFAVSSSQFSVSVPAADVAGRRIPIGAVIRADPGGEWPRLTVQRCHRLGGMIVLECSANELGARNG